MARFCFFPETLDRAAQTAIRQIEDFRVAHPDTLPHRATDTPDDAQTGIRLVIRAHIVRDRAYGRIRVGQGERHGVQTQPIGARQQHHRRIRVSP